MENFEHLGHWWLPETPQKRLAGSLKFSPGTGIDLELLGTFGHSNFHQIILGETADGSLITLQGCQKSGDVVSMRGTYTHNSKYLIQLVFNGSILPQVKDSQFIKSRANFSYLYDWVGVSGIKLKHIENSGVRTYQSTYSAPKDITVATSSGSIRFTFAANIRANYDISNVTEKTFVVVETDEPRNVFKLFNTYIIPIQNLINLGTTKINFIEEFSLFHPDVPDQEIKVYFQQGFYQPKAKANLPYYETVFGLSNIQDNLEEVFQKWFNLAEELNSILNLFTRARISSEIFLELKFLTVAQALETYHRTRRVNSFMPKAERRKMIKEIIENVPDEHRQFVKDRLGNNEKSLLVRLDELLQEKAVVMTPIVNSLDEFAKRTRDTRNYYTHYGKEKKKNAATRGHLHWLTEKLLILLQSCLMGEIGIPPENQVALFKRYEFYNTLISRKDIH